MPQVNLDDPATQKEIRQIKITTSILDQLRNMSELAYKNAKLIKVPILVIQRKQDEIVVPKLTKRLLRQFSDKRLQYLEVNAGHDLTNVSNPAWAEIENAITNFAIKTLEK